LTVKAQCLGACMHAFWKRKRKKENKLSSLSPSMPRLDTPNSWKERKEKK